MKQNIADVIDSSLTEAEKAAPTYLEWPDETIARAVRALAAGIGDEMGNLGMMAYAAFLVLAGTMRDAGNKTTATWESGDQVVTVRIRDREQVQSDDNGPVN